jgi:hypothetical protein
MFTKLFARLFDAAVQTFADLRCDHLAGCTPADGLK